MKVPNTKIFFSIYTFNVYNCYIFNKNKIYLLLNKYFFNNNICVKFFKNIYY